MTAEVAASPPLPVSLYHLGVRDYLPVWQAMRRFTDERDARTPDQLWLVEHAPVFTQGQAGRAEHVLMAGDIPVVQTDRGGQVTYHGPGQLIAYPLLDVRRRGLGVRAVVSALEGSVIDALAEHGIDAHARADAPGVYVGGAKIASLGLRIRRGSSFHGIAFNLDMDLGPFGQINPCGHAGQTMTQLRELVAGPVDRAREAERWLGYLSRRLGGLAFREASGIPEVLAEHSRGTGSN
ncbi:lipoyl(octanoyl) transferase [Kushneria sinocarnis]|uniref:Octanoyltransferase n=1 Tax=Kushneria sinocarnis TaxID=595502 RepID=A0A420WYZ7_9GAMM|nr:lipoyl(octanoyl) transferase LipB [Kushneria sinocarnis]RKR06403.1 lipoyl(octanoyl) transferase [Kushneria sinocarnis]